MYLSTWYYMYIVKNKRKKEYKMTEQVYVADNGVAISEGFDSLEELIAEVTAQQTFNFIDVVWEDGTSRRLFSGVDY